MKETLQKDYDEMMLLYSEIKRYVRRKNKFLYERWKAGVFCIDNDIVSMYPYLEEVIEQLNEEEEEEIDKEDSDDDE